MLKKPLPLCIEKLRLGEVRSLDSKSRKLGSKVNILNHYILLKF